MGSVNPPKNRDYSDKTRIDLKQSYQVAYWKERFGVSEQELSEAVLAAGGGRAPAGISTVTRSRCKISVLRSISFNMAGIPPARCTSSMCHLPAGLTLHR